MAAAEYRSLVSKGNWRRGLRRDGRLNKTESRFAGQLEEWRVAGLVKWWIAKPHSFRLGDRCFWKPDFLVVWDHAPDPSWELPGSYLQVVDVKGGPVEDDTAVKLKVAAEMYPCYLFSIVRRRKAAWVWEHL